MEQEEIISSRDAYISRLRSRDIFFIGRITEKCGLDLLLDALNSDGCKNITIDVIGDGSMLDFYKTKSDWVKKAIVNKSGYEKNSIWGNWQKWNMCWMFDVWNDDVLIFWCFKK